MSDVTIVNEVILFDFSKNSLPFSTM